VIRVIKIRTAILTHIEGRVNLLLGIAKRTRQPVGQFFAVVLPLITLL
jgi:hypothetical protein